MLRFFAYNTDFHNKQMISDWSVRSLYFNQSRSNQRSFLEEGTDQSQISYPGNFGNPGVRKRNLFWCCLCPAPLEGRLENEKNINVAWMKCQMTQLRFFQQLWFRWVLWKFWVELFQAPWALLRYVELSHFFARLRDCEISYPKVATLCRICTVSFDLECAIDCKQRSKDCRFVFRVTVKFSVFIRNIVKSSAMIFDLTDSKGKRFI